MVRGNGFDGIAGTRQPDRCGPSDRGFFIRGSSLQSHYLAAGLDAAQVLVPVVVLILKLFKTAQIIGQDIAIARRKTFIVG